MMAAGCLFLTTVPEDDWSACYLLLSLKTKCSMRFMATFLVT